MDGLENRATRAGRTHGFSTPPVARVPSAPTGAEGGVVSVKTPETPAPRLPAGWSDTPPLRTTPAAPATGLSAPALEVVKPVTDPIHVAGNTGDNAAMMDDSAKSSPSGGPADSAAARTVPGTARDVRAIGQARGPFVPLLLGALALVIWFGMQSWLLQGERSALQAAHSAQQQTVENAAKLRQSLDGIAADTQRLSDAGNANARLLVEELRKRGVTINPNAPTTAGGPK